MNNKLTNELLTHGQEKCAKELADKLIRPSITQSLDHVIYTSVNSNKNIKIRTNNINVNDCVDLCGCSSDFTAITSYNSKLALAIAINIDTTTNNSMRGFNVFLFLRLFADSSS